MVGSWSVHYVLPNFSENVLGYSGMTVLTACINTMHSWGLEMFWVILWRQCLLLVQTLCRAEVWKCSGSFCEDSAYCLCKHYAQLRSGNVLPSSVKIVLTACTNSMHSWSLEMFWVIPHRVSACINTVCSWIRLEILWFTLCRQCLLLVQSSENVLGYCVQTVLTSCINNMHSRICLEMFWVMLCRQSLLLVQKLCIAEFVQKFIRIKFITENVDSYGRNK